MKAYVRWMRCHNYQVEYSLIPSDRHVPDPDELLKLPKEDIVNILCLFILEAKKASGEDYNRDTLYDLIVMVQSFFKENGLTYKFLGDDNFFNLHNTLENCMKDLLKMEKVAPVKRHNQLAWMKKKFCGKWGFLVMTFLRNL